MSISPWTLFVTGVLATATSAFVAAAPVAASPLPAYYSPGYHNPEHAPVVVAPPPPPPVVVGQGDHPSVVVDEAGTAHIAWTTSDGDQADALHYCRLKRGATACEAPALFRPEHPYGLGDGPQNNQEDGGPKLFAVGDALVLLSHRGTTYFPNPADPNTPLFETTLIYTSLDGGATFTGPAVVGGNAQGIAGVGTVYGPGNDPTIATISDTVTGGTFFQALKGTSFTGLEANLGGTSGTPWYDGSLAVDGGLPVAAFTDHNGHVIVRRWTGQGDANDAATWTPPTLFPGDDAQIAGGPSGLFVADKESGGSGPYVVHRILGATEGPALPLSYPSSYGRRLIETTSGKLLAAWTTNGDGLHVSTSPDGASWPKPTSTLLAAKGSDLNEVDLGAAADGGGFAVVHRGAGTSTEAEIVAQPFGPQSATGKLGLGGLAGGEGGDQAATAGCSEIRFGAVVMRPMSGCFLSATVPVKSAHIATNATVQVADGEVDLNGLSVTPDAGVQIVISPKQHTLYTTGGATVSLKGPGVPPVTLWHGFLHVNLKNAGVGQQLFNFDMSKFGATVEGFPISVHAPVKLTPDGVQIPIDLSLPPYFGGVTGGATLSAHIGTGIKLDSLHIGPIYSDDRPGRVAGYNAGLHV